MRIAKTTYAAETSAHISKRIVSDGTNILLPKQVVSWYITAYMQKQLALIIHDSNLCLNASVSLLESLVSIVVVLV